MTLEDELVGLTDVDSRPRALFCGWCSRACDDLLLVRLNGKENRLCPGCVADRRTKGDSVVVRGAL